MIITSTQFLARFPHLAGVPTIQIDSLISQVSFQFDPSLSCYPEVVLLVTAHQITMDSQAMSQEIGMMIDRPRTRQTQLAANSLDGTAYGVEAKRLLESEVFGVMFFP